ncbi:dTDP-4-dehydrorhamnose reductase [Desulfosporosinus fructosivorans]|uniref:dTDP-4-dehydrorhamnose reductase n=1 Tax=Desulfosporosinus fructosivorans TaxID=2018669 RepID=A0A4Z0RBW5_9FIRM|nr:dTDP-4-dehydrorhamnose reductase [Desulfosporosinus fructosivorans]TGE39729.1 dTDP-4-dehydrorhamnose reductase [Desulfosporosinus fructosivorans]
MKVLITGATGQLGSSLTQMLKMGTSELGGIPGFLEAAEIEGVDFQELDITDLETVLAYTANSKPDLIINCAAYTNVDGCETYRDDAFKVNALGARNMAIAAEQIEAKLVHISTDYVFAGNGTKPDNEASICHPQSAYGTTKYLGEQYVRDFCSRYFIVRTAWLYSPIGKNFVKTIMRAGRERGALKVVNDQIGNPTNAVDLAYHILKIAATQEYGIYHCTGNGECSWFDFASKIIEYAGIKATVSPCTTEDYPSPAKRPAYSALDNMMLRCTVGDEMRNWQDALRYFMDHYDGE